MKKGIVGALIAIFVWSVAGTAMAGPGKDDLIMQLKELVERQGPFWNLSKRSEENAYKWKDRAKKFDARVKKRWSRPDPHRSFIISMISPVKDASVLDIGAGTGSYIKDRSILDR